MSLDVKIGTLLKTYVKKELKSSDHFGLEVEYEFSRDDYPGLVNIPKECNFWIVDGDGSLRNGIELVSKPIKKTKITTSITELERIIKKNKFIASKRCGIHTHFNQANKTIGQMCSFIVASVLAEPFVFQTYAKGRDDSNFCVPLLDCAGQTERIANAVQMCRTKNITSRYGLDAFSTPKYTGINIRPLSTLGTIEHRYPFSTTDIKEIEDWIKYCARLNDYSKNYNDPIDLLEEYNQKNFLLKVFKRKIIVADEHLLRMSAIAAKIIAGKKMKNWKELKWRI